jgi:hypothetical protein
MVDSTRYRDLRVILFFFQEILREFALYKKRYLVPAEWLKW